MTYSQHKIAVVAELDVTPIGSSSTSVGSQIAEAIKAIRKINGIKKYEVHATGTVLEADEIDKIFEAAKAAEEAIFNLGEKRVQMVLKIDERHDKAGTIESKIQSVKNYGAI